jgi:hypothetical protein
MKKFFGILFVILGIVCLPSVFAPSAAETIGRLIGWAITSVIPAYFLLRNTSKKDDNQEK